MLSMFVQTRKKLKFMIYKAFMCQFVAVHFIENVCALKISENCFQLVHATLQIYSQEPIDQNNIFFYRKSFAEVA